MCFSNDGEIIVVKTKVFVSFSYEADPDATDDRGFTALRYAMEFCQEESAKILDQFIGNTNSHVLTCEAP